MGNGKFNSADNEFQSSSAAYMKELNDRLMEIKEAPCMPVYSFTEDQLIDFCTKIAVRLVECGTLPMQPKDKLSKDMNFYDAVSIHTDIRTMNVMWAQFGYLRRKSGLETGINWTVTVKEAHKEALKIKWRTASGCGPATQRQIEAFFSKFDLEINI